jgi:hypothetical protein
VGQAQLVKHGEHAGLDIGQRGQRTHPVLVGKRGSLQDGLALGRSPGRVGGGNWKFNLAEGRPERIRLRGKDVLARPEVASGAGEIERLLAVITAANPMAGRFAAIPYGPDGRLDRARLDAAVRHGFRIIRWHPDRTETPAGR